MASNAVDLIIKAIQDKEYRELLFRDKDRALSMYKLTEEEIKALKGLERRTFDEALAKMGSELQKRIALGGSDFEGARLQSLDYPVIEDYDAG